MRRNKINWNEFLASIYNRKFKPETLSITESINNSLHIYTDLFYNFDFKKVDSLEKNRSETKQAIKDKINSLPKFELMFVTSMKETLELLLDLSDFRMGLEY